MSRPVEEIVRELERMHAAIDLPHVAAWKEVSSRRRAVGCLPVFAPREVLWAAGVLPVFVRGAGDRLETVRGDAYYQSYICHLPRSTIELGVSGALDGLDGMIFPNTCDVIRNLSGIWRDVFPGKWTFFLDPPHATLGATATTWWRGELARLYREACALTGREACDDDLRTAIDDYAQARMAARVLARARADRPWIFPADEVYLLRRAGDSLPPLTWVDLVAEYLCAANARTTAKEDRIRVVIVGSFCEQPPLGLLRAIERAGCYVVDDDLTLSAMDLPADAPAPRRDPLTALARAYVVDGAPSAIRWDAGRARGVALVESVRQHHADGVVFAAPSFCDPALLDQPQLTRWLEGAHVPYTAFKYAENTGQFHSIREQAGTFSDSVKLWGDS
jgi:benzoyl-CoA reductase subunit C